MDVMMRRRELMGMQGKLKTVSGPIVTVNDALARNAKSLIVNFAPVQAAGTPAPDNVLPISGWTGVTGARCGKNLCPISGFVVGGITDATGEIGNNNARVVSGFIPVKPHYKYTASIEDGKKVVCFHFYKSDNTGIGTNILSETVTAPNDSAYVRVVFGFNDNSPIVPSDLLQPQVEPGSTPTTYTPYTGTTYPVDWTDEAGTVYGGYVDLVSGVLTVDKGNYVGEWQDGVNEQSIGETMKRRRFTLGYLPKSGTANNISNVAVYGSGDGEHPRFYTSAQSGIGYAYVIQPNDTSETQEIQVVSNLETPITYQLTPQTIAMLMGTNNVWANANGNVSLTYYAQ